jgi:hypothetical protein
MGERRPSRGEWDREIARLSPEILRDPVAHAVAAMAEQVFAEYEALLAAHGRNDALTRRLAEPAAEWDGGDTGISGPFLTHFGGDGTVHIGARPDCPDCLRAG